MRALAPNGNPLEACIPFDTHEGHLLAWKDADAYVRTLPLYWQGQTDRPAFSLRIAQARAEKMGRNITVPDARMLRYVAPREDLREYDVPPSSTNIPEHGFRLRLPMRCSPALT